MATRQRRRRHQADITELNGTTDSGTSRYDMSLPQNWTVAQLKTELSKNNVAFNNTAKKAKLIQLCRENGLINNPSPAAQLQSSNSTSQTVSESTSNITELTKVVIELQKTVHELAGSVTTLQNSTVTQDNNGSVSPMPADASQGMRSSQAQMADLLGRSHTSSHTGTTEVLQDTSPQVAQMMSFPRDIAMGTSTLLDTSRDPAASAYTQTRFGYAAESLPFVETVHPTLRKQIVEGKDVNLAALLIPYYTGPHADPAVISKERVDPRLNQELTLPQFIQAFGIYKNVMCQAYPLRRLELDLYERDIVDMATRYQGKGFYEYHKMFSAQAAAHLSYSNIKVDWSVRNKTLFSNIFTNCNVNSCYHCDSTLHMASFCPKLLEKGFTSTQRGTSFNFSSNKTRKWDVLGRNRVIVAGRELCNNYNSPKGCKVPKCNFAHACIICNKTHSQQECHESKNSLARKDNKHK